MQTNQKGLDLIKSCEGLELKAYQDVVGVWTIGYGHTKGVKAGMVITAEKAEQMLKEELKEYEEGVERLIKIPLSSNEFSALVSFAYNLGLGNLGSSTLLRLLNKGDKIGASNEFEKWNKAGGKIYPGLVKRRALEKQLFLEA
jgi:lysozyme